jgi:UDP-glucose 4-epimerase
LRSKQSLLANDFPQVFTNNRILVTGGAGFIGSHLVKALCALGSKVTVLDNLSTGDLSNLEHCGTETELVQGDLLKVPLAHFLERGQFSMIFHLAANAYVPPSVERPRFDFETNLVATFRLLEAVREASPDTALVFTSSAAVYGDPGDIIISEETPLSPISPYGASKLAAEQYVSVFSKIYGLRFASARLFSVYGPRQRKQIVYDFMRKLAANTRELVVLGDGTETRDLVYVEDVVEALLCICVRARLEGECYNVATGIGHTTLEVADFVASAFNAQPTIRLTERIRPGDPRFWVADISKIRSLGFTPSRDLRFGIAETARWFKAEGIPT